MQNPGAPDQVSPPWLGHLARSSIFIMSERKESTPDSTEALPVSKKINRSYSRKDSTVKPKDILILSGGKPKLNFEKTGPTSWIDTSIGEGPREEIDGSRSSTPEFDIPSA